MKQAAVAYFNERQAERGVARGSQSNDLQRIVSNRVRAITGLVEPLGRLLAERKPRPASGGRPIFFFQPDGAEPVRMQRRDAGIVRANEIHVGPYVARGVERLAERTDVGCPV